MRTQQEQYFAHDADIGIIGRGKTITEAFVSAAESVFSIMTDLKTIKPTDSINIDFEETDIELALVEWLNLLIAESQSNGLIFCQFELNKDNHHWHGKAWGESWSEETIRGTEVKGATLTMLSVKKTNREWEARCVVDV
jgi:SHS2 domain-containing protein